MPFFNDGELIEKQVCEKNARTGPDGKNYLVDYYNLDVVMAVIYRVKSPNASSNQYLLGHSHKG